LSILYIRELLALNASENCIRYNHTRAYGKVCLAFMTKLKLIQLNLSAWEPDLFVGS
jgi:hypothetical protein